MMHKSSQQIGAIAAALAKAQAQLANPEKTLTATVPSLNGKGGERIFRYASLSSGLEIVRKALGSNEIALIQTTAIERKSNLIQLTTTLAHSSGEWLASEWPVCEAGETANPQRLGTALTYARRYALFALVGIAGEDDLDAPDPESDSKRRIVNSPKAEDASAGEHFRPLQASVTRGDVSNRRPTKTIDNSFRNLPEAASARLRDRMIGEIANLCNSKGAAAWAHKCLPQRDTLSSLDAQLVEAEFRKKIESFGDELFPNLVDEEIAPLAPRGDNADDPISAAKPSSLPTRHDLRTSKSSPPKFIRLRDREHCKFVAQQPCVVCGRSPADAHHLRFAQPRALGRKVSDEYTVPVCRTHHRELHRYGDEVSWWAGVSIDPVSIALDLWQHTRTDVNAGPP